MEQALFSITCTTCKARLAVYDASAVGAILECPKCGSMVEVRPPAGWQPPVASAAPLLGPKVLPGSAGAAHPAAPSAAPVAAASAPASAAAPVAKAPPVVVPPVVRPGVRGAPRDVGTVLEKSVAAPAAAADRRWRSHRWRWAAGGALLTGLTIAMFVIADRSALSGKRASLTALPASAAVADAPAKDSASPAAEPSPLPAALVDLRWLPDDTSLVIRFAPVLLPRSTLRPPLAAVQETAQRLLRALKLTPQSVRRVTLVGCDLRAWPEGGLALVELAGDGDATPLRALGGETDVEFAGVRCRTIVGEWPHPIAVVDAKTIVTAPRETLLQLRDRAAPKFKTAALETLAKSFSADAEWAVICDTRAAQAAGWKGFDRIFEVWPKGDRAWRPLWEEASAFGGALTRDGQLRADLAWICDDVDHAARLHADLDQWLAAARATLNELAARVDDRLRSGTLGAAAAVDYRALLGAAASAAQATRSEQARDTVWLHAPLTDAAAELAALWQRNETAARADWFTAAMEEDRQRQQGLLEGMIAFARADGAFPAGATGSEILPPETRLSWIAQLLPYLGHEEWWRRLQVGYAWNSAANQAVTRQSLPEVENPTLGQATTEAGFPVSHYVGLAGLGADAASLPPTDPRAGVFGNHRRARPEQISDGASNTIAIVGVTQRAGPWAQGGSATVRPFTAAPFVDGPDGFGSGQPEGMLVGMADGSVRFVSKTVDPHVVERLATIAGGEAANASDLGPAPWDAPVAAIASAATSPAPENRGAAPPAAAVSAPRRGDLAAATAVPAAVLPVDPAAPLVHAAAEGETRPARIAARSPIKMDIPHALATPIAKIELKEMPWYRAVDLVAAMGRLPVGIDSQLTRDHRGILEEPVSLSLEMTNVGAAIAALADAQQAAAIQDEFGLTITLPAAERTELRKVRLRIGDLLPPTAGETAESGQTLSTFITQAVHPETWQTAGGSGRLRMEGAELVVEQTAIVRRDTLCFLDSLRVARHLPARETATVTSADLMLAATAAKAEAALDRQVTVNFQAAGPLDDVLKALSAAGAVTIAVDWPALAAIGVARDTPVTVDGKPQSLREALNAIGQSLSLDFAACDEKTIQLTSAQRMRAELIPRFYAIPAKGNAAGNSARATVTAAEAAQLIDEIRRDVAPQSWSGQGGAGAILFEPVSGQWIVVQSAGVHRRLSAWIENRGAAPVAPPTVGASAAGR